MNFAGDNVILHCQKVGHVWLYRKERRESLGLLVTSERLALLDLWAQLCCQTISEHVHIVTEYRIGWVLDESDFPVVVEARGSRGGVGAGPLAGQSF